MILTNATFVTVSFVIAIRMDKPQIALLKDRPNLHIETSKMFVLSMNFCITYLSVWEITYLDLILLSL